MAAVAAGHSQPGLMVPPCLSPTFSDTNPGTVRDGRYFWPFLATLGQWLKMSGRGTQEGIFVLVYDLVRLEVLQLLQSFLVTLVSYFSYFNYLSLLLQLLQSFTLVTLVSYFSYLMVNDKMAKKWSPWVSGCQEDILRKEFWYSVKIWCCFEVLQLLQTLTLVTLKMAKKW